MKKNQLKWGIIFSYAQTFIKIIEGLLYSPILVKMLGQSEYGLYQTVFSTISTLSILSLGFNAGYVKWMSQYRQQGRQKDIDRLNGVYAIIFSLLSFIVFISGTILTLNLNVVYGEGLTADEYKTATVLAFLTTINLSLTFITSVFTTILSANERFFYLKLMNLIRSIASPIVILILLYCGLKSIALCIVAISFDVLTFVVHAFYVLKVLKNRFSFNGFEKGLLSNIFGFTFFVALNLIVEQVNNSLDKVLLGRFQGTAQVAIYSIGYSLVSHYTTLSSSIAGVFTPKIHKILSSTSESKEQSSLITELFVKVSRIQFFVLGLFLTGFILYGKQFITCFWLNQEYSDSYYVLILLTLSITIPLTQNLGIEVQRALNKHKFRSILYFCMAIVNVLITIPLCKEFGAIGAAIGTAISYVVVNTIVMNIYYHRACRINIFHYWKNILSILRGFVLPVLFAIVFNTLFDTTKFIWFFISVALYSIIYLVSVWFVCMNNFEKELIKKPVSKVIRRFTHGIKRY